MGIVLLIVGGFLLGGAWSLWQQGRDSEEPRRGRQLRIVAVVLVVAGLVAALGGVVEV